MKKQFANEIKAGDMVDDFFVLYEKILAQKRDGNNFLNVTLSDKTGTIKGVVWDNVEQIAAGVNSGDVVHVKGGVNEYRGSYGRVFHRRSRAFAFFTDSPTRYRRNVPASFEDYRVHGTRVFKTVA